MPFALKRPSAANPKVKEYKSHDIDGDGYVEIVKYKTRARALAAAAEWGGGAEVIEVPWGVGDLEYYGSEEQYPDY